MASMRKIIAWDWNGTLLDDTHIVHESTNAVLANVKHPAVSRVDFHAHYGMPLGAFYKNIGMSPAQIEAANADYNLFHNYYEARVHTAPLRDGALDILSHVKNAGILSFILSNHVVDPIRGQLKRLGIEHFFTDILAFSSRETQFKDLNKRDRLKKLITDEKVSPQDVLIIGDTPEEIAVANELGVTGVSIAGGCFMPERLLEGKPHYLIHDLHELKSVLQERGFV